MLALWEKRKNNPFTIGPNIYNDIKEFICNKEKIEPFTFHNNQQNIIKDQKDIDSQYNDLEVYSFFSYNCNGNNKYENLKNLLTSNFYRPSSKVKIVDIFCKINRVYNSFRNLVKIIKRRYMKKFDYNCDLYGNDISSLKNNILIELVEDNTKYIFRISDLIKIINNSLTNNGEMYGEPHSIKNPFTNKVLSKHNLYNIYFKIKFSNFIMPTLFHLYYKENFHINNFHFNYEEIIREETIKNLYDGLQGDQLKKNINAMLKKYRRFFRLTIDTLFPLDILSKAFKPFLWLHLEIKYTMNKYKRAIYLNKLKKRAMLFKKKHPTFGRKIYRINRITKKRSIHFCSEFTPFEKLILNNEDVENLRDDSSSECDSDSDEDEDVNIIVNALETNEIGEDSVPFYNNNFSQNNEFSLWLQRQILDSANVIRQEATTNLELELNEMLEDGEINEITGEINENNGEECDFDPDETDPYYEEERTFPYNYDSH